ncbi:hypothetical protein [Kordia jejudonensis]|uniref:hypothetical protein n=1 Tax=Kordia jejudonensis TaxID=1348245 RepID=UPI0006297524|nr:hypothetical protein [Kordia jejudonensis]
MKKKKLVLGKLNLKKSKVATLESTSITGGFQSWTGTAEPCFPTELNCNTNDCTTGITLLTCDCNFTRFHCPTADCPPQTLVCNSHSVCPPGVYCY